MLTPFSSILCCHSLTPLHPLLCQSHHKNNFPHSDAPLLCFSHSPLVPIWFSLLSKPKSGWVALIGDSFFLKDMGENHIISLTQNSYDQKANPSVWVYPEYRIQPQHGATNHHIILNTKPRKKQTAQKCPMKHAECRPSLTTNNNSCEEQRNVFSLSNLGVIKQTQSKSMIQMLFFLWVRDMQVMRPLIVIVLTIESKETEHDSLHWKGQFKVLMSKFFFWKQTVL